MPACSVQASHHSSLKTLRRFVMAALLIVLLGSQLVRGASPTPSPIKRSSSAIAITPNGATLLVVNPDSNSVTLVDTASRSAIAELPVGIDPRTITVNAAGGRAYVANRGSASLSVIDLAARQVITTAATGDRPYGILTSPSADRLYVAEQGADRVLVLDTATFQSISHIAVADRPSGLALSNDGRTLLVTHLLTNTITVVTVEPYQVFLPISLRSGTFQDTIHPPREASNLPMSPRQVNGAEWAAWRQFPTSVISLWPDSSLLQSIVVAPDGQRAYVPHTRSNTPNTALAFDTTVFPLVSQIDLTARQHLVGQQFDLGTLDPPGVGLPFDAALTPDGRELWVVNAASNDLSVINLISRTLAAHVKVGDNPRGIVLSPDGSLAYVNNTLAGTAA
jgi:YVTN family beta-propeller protein